MFLKKIQLLFSQSLKKNERIIFFGSWPVGYPTLKTLHHQYGSNNLQVITHSSSPLQINNPSKSNQIQQFCSQHNIVCHSPVHKMHAFQQKHNRWKQLSDKLLYHNQIIYKLGIVCSYGYMIPANILKVFKDSLILIHPSLIPKYRGGAPIYHAIANGDRITGISYLEVMPNQFDTGNLLHQIQYEISKDKNYRQIEEQLAEEAARNLPYVINNLIKLRPGLSQKELIQKSTNQIKPEQLSAKIVHQKLISPTLPAQKVYNLNRAMMTPRMLFNKKQLIVQFDSSYLEDSDNKYQPGQLILHGKHLYMKCQDKLIKLKKWQEPTKKQLPIYMFINQFIQDRKKYNNTLFFQ